jgi:threonine/homoserine/homoserine lactone efflux protein
MMNETALNVAALFLVYIATPGASFVLVVSSALDYGRVVGYSIALGLSTADICLSALALEGLSEMLSAEPITMIVFGCFGGAWIAGVGLKMMISATATSTKLKIVAGTPPSLSTLSAYRLGLTAGFINLQTILFIASIFAGVGASSLSTSATYLGALAIVSVVTRCGIARVFTVAKIQAAYLSLRSKIQIFAGLTILFFGADLAVKSLSPVVIRWV